MIKARRFCRRCNGGWMNEIDQDVRRLLQYFALDAPTVLSADDQRDLALWTTKTVLGLLSIEPDRYRLAERGLYSEFHRTRKPLSRSPDMGGRQR
jgi:hypothetical protein